VYCPDLLSGGVGSLHSAHLLAAAGGGGLLEADSNENPLRTTISRLVPGIENGSFNFGGEPRIGIDVPLAELDRWRTNHQVFSDV